MRAIGALLVVASHLLIFYVSDVSSIFPWILSKETLTFSNDVTRIEDILLKIMTETNINFGALGVSIFFLISGFCLMITLDRSEKILTKIFLLKKLLRLYPVYIAGFGIGTVLFLIYTEAAGTEFKYTVLDCFMQITLTGRLFGFASIDGLVWTLEVQLLFYILAYVLYRFNLLDNPIQILKVSFCILLLKFIFANTGVYFFVVLSEMIPSLFIMFIGICCYKCYSEKWSIGETLGLTVLLFFAYSVTQSITAVSYFVGLLLFITMMFADKYYQNGKQSKLLGFISQISYSLYASHSLISYNLLSVFNHWGVYPTAASFIVLSVEFIAAIALYYLVEKPSARLMSRILMIGVKQKK